MGAEPGPNWQYLDRLHRHLLAEHGVPASEVQQRLRPSRDAARRQSPAMLAYADQIVAAHRNGDEVGLMAAQRQASAAIPPSYIVDVAHVFEELHREAHIPEGS